MAGRDSSGAAVPGITSNVLDVPVCLALYLAGVDAVTSMAGLFSDATWNLRTPCPEWRAADLAGHLRCVADDYHEYLDNAPVSRFARLMTTGANPEKIARKLARQNAAELAALPDDPPSAHIAAFAQAARRYAVRLPPLWSLPHHTYRGEVVTVGAMACLACLEWHLHAWDLARALGLRYRPVDPALLVAAWAASTPGVSRPPGADPWRAVLCATGREAGGSAA